MQGVFSEVMPIRKSNDTLFYLIGAVPVVWLALLLAQSLGGGLPELLPSREEIADLYAKDDSIAFVDSILTGYEKKKVLMERFMEKGLPEQTYLKRSTGFER